MFRCQGAVLSPCHAGIDIAIEVIGQAVGSGRGRQDGDDDQKQATEADSDPAAPDDCRGDSNKCQQECSPGLGDFQVVGYYSENMHLPFIVSFQAGPCNRLGQFFVQVTLEDDSRGRGIITFFHVRLLVRGFP